MCNNAPCASGWLAQEKVWTEALVMWLSVPDLFYISSGRWLTPSALGSILIPMSTPNLIPDPPQAPPQYGTDPRAGCIHCSGRYEDHGCPGTKANPCPFAEANPDGQCEMDHCSEGDEVFEEDVYDDFD